MSVEQVDRKDLKIQALLEKIGSLENQVADLRVDVTLLSVENESLKEKLATLEDEDVQEKTDSPSD